MDFQKLLFQKQLEEKYSFYRTLPCHLSSKELNNVLEYLRSVCKVTPLFTPTMRDGTPYRVQITSIGKWGWISDEKGYYYSQLHPNGKKWLPITNDLYDIICRLFDYFKLSYNSKCYDSCLINYYNKDSRLGMHIDNTEKDLNFPILSISIGATAKFNIELGSQKLSYLLENNSIIIMDGLSRNCKHGIIKIIGDEDRKINPNPLKIPNTRINLTFRKTGL
jgi:alkylated DNA repair protein (DNA oxidative demethylase)